MDSDTAPSAPALPRSTPFDPARPDPGAAMAAAVPADTVDRNDRNNVFGHLVRDDGDIAGLVAYSIYKQHKLDWLRAFEAARGRVPDENEMASYGFRQIITACALAKTDESGYFTPKQVQGPLKDILKNRLVLMDLILI